MRFRFAALALVLVGASCVTVTAQERMPLIPPDELTDAQKKAVAAYKASRGPAAYPGGPYIPLLRSPELLVRQMGVADHILSTPVLPPRLSELASILSARQWTQHFVWHNHYPRALRAGLKAEIANAVAEGRRPDSMPDEEAAVYDFVTELYRNHSVSDATYARALSTLGEQGIVDLIGYMGHFTTISMLMSMARTPLPATPGPAVKLFTK